MIFSDFVIKFLILLEIGCIATVILFYVKFSSLMATSTYFSGFFVAFLTE
jgi:hypothetical protein